MSMNQRIQAKRREILCIAAAHGAHNVRVFGSAARGESGPDSDVDFLVAVQPEHSSWFPAGLIVDLEKLLGCEVDVVTKEALHWYIHDRVLEEAVPLWRTEVDWTSIAAFRNVVVHDYLGIDLPRVGIR